MKNKKLILNESSDELLDIELPLEDISIEDIPAVEVEPVVDSTVKINAYSDMLQGLLKVQWDVINEADSIMNSLSFEEDVPFDKEKVIAVLKKLVEDTTVSIGVTTKAMSVVDPSQEELMGIGVEKADEVIDEIEPESKEEEEKGTVEESLNEDSKEVQSAFKKLKDLNYYERYWAEEALYQIEYMLDNLDNYDDEEYVQILNTLPDDKLIDICLEVSGDISSNEFLWEGINDSITESIRRAVEEYEKTIKTVDLDLSNTNKEGE